MDDLVRQGKVRYTGCSNFDAEQLDEALAVSKLQQCTAFACHQVCYNLLDRHLDDEVETIFLMPRQEYFFTSSQLIKQVARLGGKIDRLVPDNVSRSLKERFNS